MSEAALFHGVIPYLATPMRAGQVDEVALGALCERLIAAGVHGLCPLGSTGEFAYLTFAQKERVVAATVEAAAGRVPVIAGAAATATEDACAQARRWEALGVDGVLAVMEAYFPVSEDGIVGYFTAVAEATGLPTVLYTNPNFQRSDLSIPALERLARHPRIAGVKHASSSPGRLLPILTRTEGRLGIYAASAHITAAVMLIGGRGWMAGPSCLIPEQSVKLYELCRTGDWGAAMALQKDLWAVNEVFATFNLAGAVKAGLKLQGLDCGDPIAPQAPLSAEAVEAVAAALRGAGALD